MSADDLDACFRLIELSSLEDYKRSKGGWKPKAKRKEMRLLDLKYLLVKNGDQIEGFCSFMPTTEDECFVVYCYEIHLAPSLQGQVAKSATMDLRLTSNSTGMGKILMNFLDAVSRKIPNTEKIMLTCFLRNAKALQFYRKLGFETDEYSPPPKILRNGTKVEADYVILSKEVNH